MPNTLPTLPIGENDVIWVTTSAGWDVKGDVSAVGPTGIDLFTDDGLKHLDTSEILRIDRRDSNWSGFVKGVGVGALGWAMMGGKTQVSDAHGNVRTERIGFGPTVMGLLLFGGAGAVIDSVIEGRDTIYTRPETPSSLSVQPMVTMKSIGVGGSFSWK